MAKLNQLIMLENMMKTYDAMNIKDANLTHFQGVCTENLVDEIIGRLKRLVASKVRMSCRNVLLANYETMTYYHTYRLYTIRAIISRWAPPNENNTKRYIENVARLTGITPDEPLGIPSEKPARWMMLGAAMGIQECGLEGFDWFAMLRGWEMARSS